jgi:hypothetical protein
MDATSKGGTNTKTQQKTISWGEDVPTSMTILSERKDKNIIERQRGPRARV